jgi:hypothetical protein
MEGGDVRLVVESQRRATEGGDVRLSQAADRQRGVEGGDVRLSTEAQQQRDAEQFGDIRATNPLTGNRVEDDLDRGGAEVNKGLRTLAEGSSETPTLGVPTPTSALSTAVAAERAAFRVGAEFGLDPADNPLTVAERGEIEGPLERTSEAFVFGVGNTFNPFEATADAKEVVEFGATQGGRVGRTATRPSGTPATAGTGRGVVEKDLRSGQLEETEFERDVEQRAERTASAAAEAFSARPAETTATVGGGLASSLIVGAGVARGARAASGGRIASGSDLSGRALTGLSKRARRFAADERGQGDLTGLSRSGGESGDTLTLTADDISRDAARADPTRGGRFGDTGPSRVTSQDISYDLPARGGSSDTGLGYRSAASESDTAVRGGLERKARAEASSFRTRERLAGAVAGSAAAASSGLVSGALARQRQAQQPTLALGRDLAGSVDTGAATGPRFRGDVDVRSDIRGDVDRDARTDIEGRVDSEARGRFDTRFDTRQDIRTDARQDLASDVRSDTEPESRQDIRTDLRTDSNRRRDLDLDPRLDSDEASAVSGEAGDERRFEFRTRRLL